MAEPPRKRRVVLCLGQHCNRNGRAETFYERLQQALGDPGPAFMARGPVSWEIANCLNMCDDGPNLVMYPEKRCFHHLTLADVEQVIAELHGTAEPGD